MSARPQPLDGPSEPFALAARAAEQLAGRLGRNDHRLGGIGPTLRLAPGVPACEEQGRRNANPYSEVVEHGREV